VSIVFAPRIQSQAVRARELIAGMFAKSQQRNGISIAVYVKISHEHMSRYFATSNSDDWSGECGVPLAGILIDLLMILLST